MINSDVQLFWANNKNNDIVIIYDMDENDRNNKYTCPVCGSEVKPVAIGGMTKDGKVAQVSSHFSHYDASKCNNETAIHWWFKNKILINGDSFIIKTDVESKYKCKEVLIEQFYNTEFGIYRPDITIITECGKTIYFEMNYTNKKKVEDYLDKWLELGNPVVEVDLKTLMNASFSKNTYEFRALFYDGKCFNVKKSDLYYDTIGRFKERIYLNNTIDDNIRERIKQLEWFWMETINYRRGETNIEQLVNYIDCAEQDEKDLIFMILSKKRCVPIYEDYINYKVDLFEKLAKDYIENFVDIKHQKYFTINKMKTGRKYKNIEYNTIQFKNQYCFDLNLNFDLVKFIKEDYIKNIKDNINIIVELISFYDRGQEISLFIKEKYYDNLSLNGLNIYVDKSNNLNDNYLYKITLKEWYMIYASIYISIDHIRYGGDSFNIDRKDIDNIKLDILDINNNNRIIEFISKIINKGLLKYNQILIEKEEQNRKEQEELLLKIEEDKQTYCKILSKIINIFDRNKDKIIKYQTDYMLDNNVNLLYFEDYRGIEFIIYNRSYGYLHENNPNKKSFHNVLYNYNGNCKLIEFNLLLEIELSLENNIYITETKDSYKISNRIDKPNYKFPTYFNNSEINLSFRDMGHGTKYLPRYNFLNVVNEINEIFKKVSNVKYEFVYKYYKTYDNEIYCISEITDEEINKEVYKLLYPIINLADKNPNDILNIKLNADFTMENNKKQPWLIKDFIYALNLIGVKNIHNII